MRQKDRPAQGRTSPAENELDLRIFSRVLFSALYGFRDHGRKEQQFILFDILLDNAASLSCVVLAFSTLDSPSMDRPRPRDSSSPYPFDPSQDRPCAPWQGGKMRLKNRKIQDGVSSKRVSALILRWIMALFIVTLSAHSCSALDEPFIVSITCRPGGIISVERAGKPSVTIGRVLAIPDSTRWPSFTASAWGEEGTVVATAVNAIHILLSVEKGRGRTMSILPAETVAPAAGPGASIITDMKAGRALFGAWAPAVGSSVRVILADGVTEGEAHTPLSGETLRIAMIPLKNPYFLEIENRPGGRVTAWYESGPEIIARVIRPVGGTGRFEGTIFQEPGRVRANHPGVIDISTSPEGLVGGFQIMPLEHASSSEMQGAWKMTQWMIVAPATRNKALKGTKPLFSGGLLPGPGKGESLWDLWATYGRRPLVLVRIGGGAWIRMPVISGRQDHSLEGVTHLRIYFPFTGEPQEGGN